MGPRLEKFLESLRDNGGDYTIMWRAYRAGDEPSPNVFYVALYQRLDADGRRPFFAHAVFNDFGDRGFEVLFASEAMTCDDIIARILGDSEEESGA